MKSLMKKIVVFLSAGLMVSSFVYGRANAAVPTDAPTSVTVSTKDGTGTATIKWTPLTVAGVIGYKVRARIGNVTVNWEVVSPLVSKLVAVVVGSFGSPNFSPLFHNWTE